MNFRKLKKSDYNEYIKLMNEFRPNIDCSKNKFEEIYDDIFKNNIIFVLEKNNELIATGKLLIDQKIIHNFAKYGHLEDIVVKTVYRGRNIGVLLVKKIINFCKENKFFKITLTCNKKLINFYKKNNFEVYDIHMSQLL
tara:strand:- start:2072 stop:2488 length:417 start_codon:yes stop_codon:yes gene_type:complete